MHRQSLAFYSRCPRMTGNNLLFNNLERRPLPWVSSLHCSFIGCQKKAAVPEESKCRALCCHEAARSGLFLFLGKMQKKEDAGL